MMMLLLLMMMMMMMAIQSMKSRLNKKTWGDSWGEESGKQRLRRCDPNRGSLCFVVIRCWYG